MLILYRENLCLNNNTLLSFDFANLISSNVDCIHIENNNLSFQSLKNFDSIIIRYPANGVRIETTVSNDDKFNQMIMGNEYIDLF